MGLFDTLRQRVSSLFGSSATPSDGIQNLRLQYGGQYGQNAATFEQRIDIYNARWMRYDNSIFEDKSVWQRYKHDCGLYRHIRPIYNPVRRLVSFYEGVYPGMLTARGDRPIDGTPLAIPLASDTPEPLRQALGVLWQWSNWQENKGLFMRHAGALGDSPVKLVDNLASRKIEMRPEWPGKFKDVQLDNAGNVTAYTMEYAILDPRRGAREGDLATYTEIVTKESYRTELDGRAYGFDGNPSEWENPYGFVPLVWYRFNNLGTPYGAEAIMGDHAKVDELCSLACMASDYVLKILGAPVVVAGADGIEDMNASLRATPTNDLSSANALASRQSLSVLHAPEGTTITTLQMQLGDVLKKMDFLLKEIEADFPELTMWSTLRQMTQTTGPAVEALAGDVKTRFVSVAAAADQQMVKLLQMGTAMAGHRIATGAWGSRSALDYKRQAFLPYDLDSYLAGDLDFEIDMRPLLPRGVMDEYEIQKKRGEAWKAQTDAGLPLEYVLRKNGYPETEVARIIDLAGGPLAQAQRAQKEADLKMQAAAAPKPAIPAAAK
jgi:hypothetical protein